MTRMIRVSRVVGASVISASYLCQITILMKGIGE
jgi:hypothetical protein